MAQAEASVEVARSPGGARAAVALRGVRKEFGDVVAVDGVDLEVGEGEFFSMLGPSGSGKTTCLRMIAGFEHADRGQVLLEDEDVTGLAPYERDVNTVFQDYALFPHMTVQENVEYGLKVKQVAKGERRDRANEALAMVQLRALGGPQAAPALGRPAAAGRARPGTGQRGRRCSCSTNRSAPSTSSSARRCRSS